MKSLIGFLYRKKMDLLPGVELGKFPPVRWIRDSWRGKVRKTAVEVEGLTIHLDPMDSLDLSVFGTYEPEEIRFLESHLRSGGVAVDVGANIGHHTLFMARAVGPAGRVYAFEPAPENFELLQKNVKANHFENVTLVNKAVLDGSRAVKLFLSDGNLGDHRVYEADQERPAVCVEGISLDEFFQGIDGPVSLVKMDVQGAEMNVLKGMQQLLERNPDIVVLMEFWPAGLSLAGTNPCDLITFLQDRGFLFWNVQQPDKQIPPPVVFDYARKERNRHSARHLDLICRRG